MKLFQFFSTALLTDGYIIDWSDSQGLVDNIVGNFAQDTFNNINFAQDAQVIQDALAHNQALIEQSIADGLNGVDFGSLQADAQAALENAAFENVFGNSAQTIFALHEALTNPDTLADTIESIGGLQAAQDALNDAQSNPAYESVFTDVGGFQNAETLINNAGQINAVPDDASTAYLSMSVATVLVTMRFY